MQPLQFRKLLLQMREDEIVKTHITNSSSGPNISEEKLRFIESVIRSKFQLTEDQRVSAIVVGSAKLGFSFIEKQKDGVVIKPAYRSYKAGYSDIDIAIISPMVYGKIWSDLANTGARSQFFPIRSKLGNYMYHGWLRPDKFPSPKPQRCMDWDDAHREIQLDPSLRNKPIRLALYHSQHFLEIYQQRGVRMARDQEI